MRRFFSSSVSIEAIKKLRSASGAPLSDCKAALQESTGLDEAFEWLRRKGIAQASKMASREAKEVWWMEDYSSLSYVCIPVFVVVTISMR